MDTGSGGHGAGSAASGSRSSGLSPNVASMSVMPSLNPLSGFGFGGAPAAHGGPVYQAQSLATTGCSPLYLPPPAGVVGPVPYPAAVSTPPHSLVIPHCGSPYPAALQSPGGPGSGPYGSSASAIVANGSSSKLLVGRHMCAICEDAASGKHYGVYRSVSAQTLVMYVLVCLLTSHFCRFFFTFWGSFTKTRYINQLILYLLYLYPFSCAYVCLHHSRILCFSRSMPCISTAYADMQCLSICPSVCPSPSWIVSKRINISSKFFHRLVAKPF